MLDEDGVEVAGDGEIVGRPERRLAEFGERKAGAAMGRLRHLELAALDFDLDGLAPLAVGEPPPGLLDAGVGFAAERRARWSDFSSGMSSRLEPDDEVPDNVLISVSAKPVIGRMPRRQRSLANWLKFDGNSTTHELPIIALGQTDSSNMTRLIIAAFTILFLFSPAEAEERITGFVSEVTINADSSIMVTETITVDVEGDQIKRGILRDLPTRYRDRKDREIEMGFELLSVKRDGQGENYALEDFANGVRIKIGNRDVLLANGTHTYEISYRTRRALGQLDAFDELYLNVTGNGWSFAIDRAEAIIHLPPGAKIIQHAAYTGPQGTKGQDFRVAAGEGSIYRAETTRRLAPGEGFTVAVGFTKGIVLADSNIVRDPTTNCAVKSDWLEITSIRWNGACVDGFIDGEGKLEWMSGKEKKIWETNLGPNNSMAVSNGELSFNFDVSDLKFQMTHCSRSPTGVREVVVESKKPMDIEQGWVAYRVIELAADFAVRKCPRDGFKNIVVNVRLPGYEECFMCSWGLSARSAERDKLTWRKINNEPGQQLARKIEGENAIAAQKIRDAEEQMLNAERLKREQTLNAERLRREKVLNERKEKAALEWKKFMEASLASNEAVTMIADLIEYDRTRLILSFRDGRKIRMTYGSPAFVNGYFVVRNRSEQTDIFKDIDREASDGFSWDKWFKMTQGGGRAAYSIVCIVSPDDAGTMTEGQEYDLNAKLLSLEGDQVAFECKL